MFLFLLKFIFMCPRTSLIYNNNIKIIKVNDEEGKRHACVYRKSNEKAKKNKKLKIIHSKLQKKKSWIENNNQNNTIRHTIYAFQLLFLN